MMVRPLAYRRSILVLLLLAILCGCGQKGPAMGRVSGVVTYQGKPLVAANVMFVPVQGGRPATATTDDQGRFTLTTFAKGDGAQVGDHHVAIVKVDTPAQTAPVPENVPLSPRIPGMPETSPPRASQIPERYGKSATSGLTATVLAGDNETTLNLTP